jgi:hypothetical protein
MTLFNASIHKRITRWEAESRAYVRQIRNDLEQRGLFRQGFVGLFIGSLQAQETLVTQAQHVPFLRIAHLHPAKAFLAAAQAATAKTAIVGLTNTATRAGYVKKLELLRHTSSCVLFLIEDAIGAAGK